MMRQSRRGDSVLLLVGDQDLLLLLLMMMFANRRRFGAVEFAGGQRRLFRLFLGLHATILEPDFDLSLSQAEGVSDLDTTTSRQVAVEMKLFLQFQCLVARVRLASPFRVGYHIYNQRIH